MTQDPRWPRAATPERAARAARAVIAGHARAEERRERAIKLHRDRAALRAMLERLIEWDAGMGGHESAVWAEARALYRATRS